MDNTIKVEDIDNMWKSTRTKMTKLENQVESLKRKMDELRQKFSRPEPETNGSEVSNVTLVCRDEKHISSHKVIISLDSHVLPQQNTEHIAVSANGKKYIEKECADVTLVCDNDKQVHAHRVVLSSNSSAAKKKDIELVNINVTLAPEDVKDQLKNFWLCIGHNMFQSSGGCQCDRDEFLQQYHVASTSPPAQYQARGFSRQHDQHGRGQVLGGCYYERGGTHRNWKRDVVSLLFVC